MERVFRRWKILSTFFFIVFVLTYVRINYVYNFKFFIGVLLFFLYYLVTLAFLYRMQFLIKLEKLADHLKFKKDFHLIRTPKMTGKYKDFKFKIEYWYKTTGKSPSRIRTYIKLYLKGKPTFSKKLEKFSNVNNLIVLKYNREKNYILLKVRGDVTDYKEIKFLMDHLLKIVKH